MTFATASGLLPAGMPFTSSGSRTEFAWKYDIKLGCKALRLKAKDAGQIDYCQLGKMAVVEAFTKNKALTDFQAERRCSRNPPFAHISIPQIAYWICPEMESIAIFYIRTKAGPDTPLSS